MAIVAGYNKNAYGDGGWDDGALAIETGIAATMALGTETPLADANVTEATTPELGMIGSLSSFEKITGTAKVEPTGESGTGATGTVKLWTLVDTTSDGTETWTTGHAN
ncbi:MAG: hypothetical protein QF535_21995 [Anaerolineales bacterium]|nr:hypothetical protein [Anaerolineales bacterium]